MQKVNLPFSKKNVPEPTRREYFKKAYNAVSKLVSKMGWHIYHVQNKERLEEQVQEDFFGFKSHRAPRPSAQ